MCFNHMTNISDQFVPVSDQATIQIRIVDVNDNEPIFDRNVYSEDVPEDEAVGSVITTVTAIDKDKGKKSKLAVFPSTTDSKRD